MKSVAKPAHPQKPYEGFPLTAHPTGRWCKKVKGRIHYFGRVGTEADAQAALDLWLKERDELLAGRIPDRSAGERLTVKGAIDAYLTTKEQHADAGQITRLHFGDLLALGKLLADELGRTRPVESLRPDDFGTLRASLSKRYGPAALLRRMVGVRSIFKFALENELIDKPVRYGAMFALPTKKDLRIARAAKGERLFEVANLLRLIDAAGVQLRAMILLGVNCGLGNSDCGQLRQRHLDLAAGWLNYPRPKTGINRRCKLWGETVAAIEAAIVARPAAKLEQHADLVFRTSRGGCWAKERMDNPVAKEFRKLLNKLQLHRAGLSFYTLRHTFETIAGGSRDQVAVDHAMGHTDSSMAAHYRERIDDERLEAVANHVHDWLYGPAKQQPKRKQEAKPKAKRQPRTKQVAQQQDERAGFRIVG